MSRNIKWMAKEKKKKLKQSSDKERNKFRRDSLVERKSWCLYKYVCGTLPTFFSFKQTCNCGKLPLYSVSLSTLKTRKDIFTLFEKMHDNSSCITQCMPAFSSLLKGKIFPYPIVVLYES